MGKDGETEIKLVGRQPFRETSSMSLSEYSQLKLNSLGKQKLSDLTSNLAITGNFVSCDFEIIENNN